MKSFRQFLAMVLISGSLAFSPGSGLCQGEEQVTPKSVTEQSFAVLKTGKADDYSKLMMPSELERFKTSMLLIGDMAKAKGQEKQFLTIFQVPDRESLEKLTPGEFLAKVMQKQLTPEMVEMYSKSDFKVLGQVMEGEDVAHCVYSIAVPDLGSRTNVISLKKEGTGWGMLLSSDLDKMMAMLKIQFAKPGAPLNLDPELRSVKVLGSVMDGDNVCVVIRSTTMINNAPLQKVAQMTFEKTDPEYKLATAGDNATLEKALEKKLGVFVGVAKAAAALHAEASKKTARQPVRPGTQPKRKATGVRMESRGR